MSSIFDNEKNKDKCQKFTPPEMVEIMLNLAGYTTNLIGHRILENSFGSGNILIAIVKRYIKSGRDLGLDSQMISNGLSTDIYGIELDEKLFLNCIEELDIIVEESGLPPVVWNLFNVDALTWRSEVFFDLVIGNPPYITYKEIDSDNKSRIKSNFSTCAIGKFDYCYAFIEAGVKLLNTNGKLVQLVPSNIYKNVFAEELRKLLQAHISLILDYPSQNIFKTALTSTSVFLYDKAYYEDFVLYKNMTDNYELQIPRISLVGKWMFGNILAEGEELVRFGDLFNASIVIATLLNEAYILKSEQIEDYEIEETIIRPTASPRSMRYKRKEFIIFPYQYVDNQLIRMEINMFQSNYPMTVQYLQSHIEKLNARKKDESTAWFEYGRSQALAHLNQEKLLMSTVVTNNVELYRLDVETIPYSGIYITVKDNNCTLDEAERILRSIEFLNYIKQVGISVSGKSIRITCKDINNFEFVRR